MHGKKNIKKGRYRVTIIKPRMTKECIKEQALKNPKCISPQFIKLTRPVQKASDL